MAPSARVLATAFVALALSFARAASASSSLELVRIAREHERANQDDLALRRYMDALALDPTCTEAYLGLGALRTRQGDLREAERVYSVALEHVPQLRAARVARAYVRRGLGRRSEAVDDLLGGAEDDLGALRVVSTWYGEDGLTPAQLAVWRRIASRAQESQDPALLREARTMVRALVILVGTADPAANPADDPSGLRRTAASIARRGGA